MNLPGDYSLAIVRGRKRTWRARLWQDLAMTQAVNLTGCTVLAAIRPLSGGDPQVTLTCSVVVEPGITAADGWISISIDDDGAALLTGSYYSWSCGIMDSVGDYNPVFKAAVHVNDDDNL